MALERRSVFVMGFAASIIFLLRSVFGEIVTSWWNSQEAQGWDIFGNILSVLQIVHVWSIAGAVISIVGCLIHPYITKFVLGFCVVLSFVTIVLAGLTAASVLVLTSTFEEELIVSERLDPVALDSPAVTGYLLDLGTSITVDIPLCLLLLVILADRQIRQEDDSLESRRNADVIASME